MNAVEIEEAVSKLVEAPFDAEGFPFEFLRAFGVSEAAVAKLRTGKDNKSDVSGAVLQRSRNNIHLKTCPPGTVAEAFAELRASPANAKLKPKFLLATDGQTVQALRTDDDEPLACDYKSLPDRFAYFLSLAGISTGKRIDENAFDIRATPTLTNAQRINLGLSERGTESSPINPPTQVADLKVVSAISRVLKVSVRDPESDGRGKPDGVAGVTCFSFVGDEAPADPAEWTYEGQSTRTNFEVIFPATVPAGAKVHLCCAWYNPRGQTGPLCNPVAAYLAGGMAAAA